MCITENSKWESITSDIRVNEKKSPNTNNHVWDIIVDLYICWKGGRYDERMYHFLFWLKIAYWVGFSSRKIAIAVKSFDTNRYISIVIVSLRRLYLEH